MSEGRALRWSVCENPKKVRLAVAKFLQERHHMRHGYSPNPDVPSLPYEHAGPQNYNAHKDIDYGKYNFIYKGDN
jgi:hypothetical protein